ncbi:MAG: TlpA family protein disulfide reductase [Planctomycetales bacterium]|nr:TlpA family protein disulfide reductase [bacterium]UNM07662.1 MAG: TlpA family protein disulfide reductase [Planctomycetales bacterium]
MLVNRTLNNLFALALTLVLLGATGTTQADAAGGCRIDIGSKAPSLAGTDLSGKYHSLDDYRGKWVYVDFWASWCGPCMRELPDVIELNREFQNSSDVAVLSISLDDQSTLKDLEKVQQKYMIDYPVVFEGTGWESNNRQSWCVDAIPATFLIDPEGNVVYNEIRASQAMSFLKRQQSAVQTLQDRGGMVTQPASTGVVSNGGAMNPPSTGVYTPHKRIQVRTGETLQEGSPSTGRGNYRDFEVMVDILENSPNVNRYQLFISTLVQKDNGEYDNIDLRYDIDVTNNLQDLYHPYNVEINDRSAELNLAGDGSSLVPGVQVMVDPYQRKYRFIIPLPERILDIHYVLGLYDANLGEYIRNQPTVVDLSTFGIEY